MLPWFRAQPSLAALRGRMTLLLACQELDKKHKYVFQQLVSQILTINKPASQFLSSEPWGQVFMVGREGGGGVFP